MRCLPTRHRCRLTKPEKENHAVCPNFPFLVFLAFTESIRVLLEGTADKLGLRPQVGGQEAVAVGDGGKSSLKGVL